MKKYIIALLALLLILSFISFTFAEIHNKENNDDPLGNRGITYSYGPQWGNNIHYPNQSQNLPIYTYDYDRNGDGIPWTGTIIPSMDSPGLEWLSADEISFSRGSLYPPQEKVINLQTHNLEVGESYDFCVCSASGGSGGQINVITWCCANPYSTIISFPIENLNVEKIGGTGRNVLLTWDLPNYDGCDIDYFALLRSQTAIVDTNYKNADIVRANLPNNITEFADTTNFGYIQSFYAIAGYDSNNRLLALSESLQPEFIQQILPLISPEDDSIITDSLITFNWEGWQNCEYELWISEGPDYTNPIIISGLQEQTYNMENSLNDHAFYYWKVKAYNIQYEIEDFETGDFNSYNWLQGGNEDWTIVTEDPFEGNFCAKSGPIGGNQTSELSINMDVLNGFISFYRKVSSNTDDYLYFYIDNECQDHWSGNIGWEKVSFFLSTGNHTFRWVYSKDFLSSSGSDCAWIDYITFPPISIRNRDEVWSSSSEWRFGINCENIIPEEFELLSPTNNDTIESLRPEFTWQQSQDSGDHVFYTLKIGFDADFDSMVVYDSLTQTKFYTPFDLQQNTTLYWKVTAYDSEGEWINNSNGVYQFTCDINDSPTQFSKIYPNRNVWDINSLTFTVVEANAQPTFQWYPSLDHDGGSVSYTVLLDTSATFGTVEIYDNIQDTAWSYTGMLEENEVYFWDVYAVDSDDDSTKSYGRPWTFVVNETDEPPLPFSLISPTDTLDNVYVNFNWEQAVDPDPHGTIGYDLWISNDNTFTQNQVFEYLPYGSTNYQSQYSNTKWNISNFNAFDDSSWYCGDESNEQYSDEWLQYLISKEIDLTNISGNISLSFKHTYLTEEPNWDGGVVLISTNNGFNWNIVYPTIGSYDVDSLYAFTYHFMDKMPAYCGNSYGWIDAEFDLSGYAGQLIRIGFLFASDEYIHDYEGWHIDNILVINESDTLLFDNCEGYDEFFEGLPNNNSFLRGKTYYWKVKAVDRYSIEINDFIFSDFTHFTIKHFPSISGYAFLEDSTEHSGIKVTLQPQSPLAVTDSIYTDSSGYYIFPEVNPGTYKAVFSKEEYQSVEISEFYIYPGDVVLDDITLFTYYLPPTDLTAVGIVNQVLLSWIPPEMDYLTGYNIYRSSTLGGEYELIGPNNGGTTFIDNTVINDSTYYYVVSAIYYVLYESEYSNEASATPWYSGPVCYVSITGVDSTGYGTLEHPLATIQKGINTVLEGDTVLVLLGTYGEEFDFNGKNITLGSMFITTNDQSYISQTILDGNHNRTVVKFDNGEDSTSVLTGFTIKNGHKYCSNELKGGGGIACWQSSPRLSYLIITGNSVSSTKGCGGGIHCRYSSPIIENVTISKNNVTWQGGGIYCWNSNPRIVNSIVSDNTGNYGVCIQFGGISISYSDFWNNDLGNFYNLDANIGVNTTTNANGDSCDVYYNIQLDPLFVDLENRDYRLTYNSPCINTGDPTSPFDPDGTPADMGVFYFDLKIHANFSGYPTEGVAPLSVQFTDLSTPPDSIISWFWDFGDGTDTTYTTFTELITHIYENPDTFTVSLTITDEHDSTDTETKINYITVPDAPAILYVPSQYSTIQAAINAAASGATVLVYPGNYYENINFNNKSITVGSLFLTSQDTTYIFQTIINGNHSGNVVQFISGEDSTAVLSGFTITNGYSERGGGIYCYNSSPRITDVVIIGNSVAWGNNETYGGGGIHCYESSPSLINVTISENTAFHYGGGIACYKSNPILKNVTINRNTAPTYNYGNGCAIYCYDSSPNIVNSIVSDNYGNMGFYNVGSGNPSIFYSDFWNNGTGNFYNLDANIGVNTTTNANGDSCDVYYNIQLDPLFVDLENGNYNLTHNSPCINAGDPTSPFDPDGTIADMGAFYFDLNIHANFSADPTSGYVPLTVNFTDTSTPQDSIITWQWYFQNDGVIDSSVQNPSYTYTTEDTFSVKLIVQSLTEIDTLIKENYITSLYGPPQNLCATPSLTDITLTWEQCYQQDILVYKIYRDTISNPTNQINSTVHPDTNYVDTDVLMNTTYYYRVTGYTTLGEETDYSNEVSAQLLPQMSVYPTSFDFIANMMSDSTIVDSFLIDNTGGGVLGYEISGKDTIADFGTCLDFDGNDDFADFGNTLLIDNDFTISLWVKFSDLTEASNYIITKHKTHANTSGGWMFSIENFGKIDFGHYGTGIQHIITDSVMITNENQWYHLAFTFDDYNNNYSLYLNSNEVKSGTAYINILENDFPVYISAYYNGNGPDGFSEIIIDEVRIWNVTRTQSEIQYNMYNELTGNETGLIAYWKFNEGSGNIAYDSTPNGNDGTLHNMDTSTCWVISDITGVSILSFNPSSGILDAGSSLSQDVIMTVDVSDLIDGFYNTSADITHNDPNVTNPFIIPVTITVDKTPPEKVTGLYSTVTMTDISLFWNPSVATDIDKYNVYRSTDPNDIIYLASVDHPDTNYVDSSIPEEQLTYYYWIAAEDINENIGEYSDSISTYIDIPAAVLNLNIQMYGNDAVLTWEQVTETVYGNPIQNLTGYIVYYAEHVYQSDTLFAYHGFTTDTTYTHQYVGIFSESMFYVVTAYAGDLDLLQDIIAEHPHMKIGELNKLIEQRKYKNYKQKGDRRVKK